MTREPGDRPSAVVTCGPRRTGCSGASTVTCHCRKGSLVTAVSRSLFLAALAAASLPASAFAQDEIRLDEIEVTAPLPSVAGTASAGYPGGTSGIGGGLRPVDAASAGIISGAAINSRPITRPGEVLESVHCYELELAIGSWIAKIEGNPACLDRTLSPTEGRPTSSRDA